MGQLLMLKDKPVLKIGDNYRCEILDFDRLPHALRYPDVNYDDIMHGWTEVRTMSLGRTNGKRILEALGIRQRNPYAIAKACHFASLSDCYWLKEENEIVTWREVSFFPADFSKDLIHISLFGGDILSFRSTGLLKTPEPVTLGQAAKSWVWNEEGIQLYKVGRKELAASRILDLLGVEHVVYKAVEEQELLQYTTPERLRIIRGAGEVVVKCNCITSEDLSIITWEDYQIYCDRNSLNPYSILTAGNRKAYAEMQVSDYLLNNSDRHEGNWGFFVDNNTGEILRLHPLLDHDQAFSDSKVLYSQTSEKKKTLLEAAASAMENSELDLQQLSENLREVQYLTEEERAGICERVNILLETRMNKNNIDPQADYS